MHTVNDIVALQICSNSEENISNEIEAKRENKKREKKSYDEFIVSYSLA